jgi:hypothetical protein
VDTDYNEAWAKISGVVTKSDYCDFFEIENLTECFCFLRLQSQFVRGMANSDQVSERVAQLRAIPIKNDSVGIEAPSEQVIYSLLIARGTFCVVLCVDFFFFFFVFFFFFFFFFF